MILEKNSKLYIAGPMTGYSQFNFPAFDAAILSLERRGYYPIPPADLRDSAVRKIALASPDGKFDPSAFSGRTWADFLAEDVKLIADIADGVAVLEGWEKSRGARLETFVASLCDKPVVWEATLEPMDDFDLVLAWSTATSSFKTIIR